MGVLTSERLLACAVYSGAPYGSTVRPASYHVPTNATWGAHPSSIARGRVPRSMSPAR